MHQSSARRLMACYSLILPATACHPACLMSDGLPDGLQRPATATQAQAVWSLACYCLPDGLPHDLLLPAGASSLLTRSLASSRS